MVDDEADVAVGEVVVRTVPAYNEPDGPHTSEDGDPYHPEGLGCGFHLTLPSEWGRDVRVFWPGDTDVLAGHEHLDVSLFCPPIGGSFTMDRHEAAALAADNAHRAADIVDAAPASPRAVFVNDATIPFQTPDADPGVLLDYCGRAEVAVLNALESGVSKTPRKDGEAVDADAIVGSDSVSRAERATLAALRDRADRVIRLDDDG